jgi:acyl carrier protein
MSEHDTLSRIGRIIAANREIAPESVSYEARLLDDLDIDSLAATEILFDIEDEFGIVVPEQRSFALATVRDLCDAVDELVRSP